MADEVPPVTGDFAAGAQVAGYRLAEHIGWGGMAVVYRAHDIRLDRWVALKILAPEIARDESFRQRFIGESRAAAAVDHPHIIPVFEAGEAGGVLFIAMRYVGGGDVGTLVRRRGPLEAARVAAIIAQVASALDAAHAAGLVHRDVKPANMLLGAASADSASPDHVYLSDFGLSRQALSAAGPTLAGQFVGTLDYMAPEQIKHRPVDGRADLYALACAAYEMLAGEPPFRRAEDVGLMWAQLAEPPPLLTSLRPDLPSAVDEVLARAMAKSPTDRYQGCLDFAASLVQACGLEWSVTGQLLAGRQAVATGQAAPPAAASPAVFAERGRDLAATRHHPAERAWSAAPLPASAGPALGATPMTGRGGPAAAETGLAGVGLAERTPGALGRYERGPGELGPGELGPGGPGPGGRGPGELGPGQPEPDDLAPGELAPYPAARRRRSPVIAAAALVVMLAITGATLLVLRGGAASDSGHAGNALPSGGTSPASAGNLGSANGPGSATDPGSAPSPGRSNSPGSAPSPGRSNSPGSATDPGGTSNPSRPSSQSTPASPGRPASHARPAGPAATVRAYIAAINGHHYRRAWHIGGRNSSSSYAAFAQGFSSTAKDTLIILSVNGNVVTARLVAVQTDGSVKTYQGTYAVEDGVITKSEVARIG